MSVRKMGLSTPSRHINPMPETRETLTDKNHTYVHGAGLGLGLEVIADPFWGNLLKDLEPKLYTACDKVLATNKRVLCSSAAYKIALLMENSPVLAAYCSVKIGPKFKPEIDVWINPSTPRDMNTCKIGHGNLSSKLITMLPHIGNNALNINYIGNDMVSAYNVEQWFGKFDAALAEVNATFMQSKLNKIERSRFQAFCLDIKSPWSTADEVAEFTRSFQNAFKEKVQFVGTFDRQQIDNLPEDVSGILFFHSIWDLEQAAQKDGLSPNIGFNGSDLLMNENDLLKMNKRTLDRLLLIFAQHPDINIMIYVQENDLGDEAAQLLIKFVNDNPELFKLGFALGGDNAGHSARMIKGRGCGSQKVMMTDSWLTACRDLLNTTICLVNEISSFCFKSKHA